MKRQRQWLGGLFALVLITACTSSASEKSSSESSNVVAYPPPNEAVAESQPRSENGSEISMVDDSIQRDEQSAALQSRLVIKDADISLLVEDTAEAVDQIVTLAVTQEGWIISSNITSFGYADPNGDLQQAQRGTIEIRVPSQQFETTLDQIKSLAIEVSAETVTGQDVSDQVVDLNSQLSNLRAAEAQLQVFMEAAANTDEVLRIYDLLVEKRGEISVVEGRLNFLTESAAYSSITTTLTPKLPEPEPVEVEVIEPPKPKPFVVQTAHDAFDTLEAIAKFAAGVLIWVGIVILPIALVIGLPLWIGYWWWERRKVIKS